MDRRVAVLVLTLAWPSLSSAECVSKGDTRQAVAAAKAVCTAFPKSPSVEIADGLTSGPLITLSLPAEELKAIVASEASVRTFAKAVLKNAAAPASKNFRLTVHTSGTQDDRLFVFRGTEKQVTAVYGDRIHDWDSLD